MWRLIALLQNKIMRKLTQSIADSLNDLVINVTDLEHGHSGNFNFIMLFVGILPVYAINLDAMSLFADSSSSFFIEKGLSPKGIT
jgi:hypothetical protein